MDALKHPYLILVTGQFPPGQFPPGEFPPGQFPPGELPTRPIPTPVNSHPCKFPPGQFPSTGAIPMWLVYFCCVLIFAGINFQTSKNFQQTRKPKFHVRLRPVKILNAPQLSLLREKLKLKFRMKQKSAHHQKKT